jgi:hypothetical protein
VRRGFPGACKAPGNGSRQGHDSPRPLGGRGEAGQLGGLEALVFGVLVFVFGTLVIANTWGVLDGKLAVSVAAANAARAFVQDATTDPAAAARAAASQAISDSGRSLSRMTLRVTGTPSRCGSVVAQVRYRVPLVSVPLLGALGHGFTVASTRTELLDPYRSGLPGDALCSAG